MTNHKSPKSRFTKKTILIPQGIEFVSAEINLVKRNNIWNKNDMLDYPDEVVTINILAQGIDKKHVALRTDHWAEAPEELEDLAKFIKSISELTGKY